MKKHSLFVLLVIIQLLNTFSLQAEIKLPAIVSSNMILQRNTTVVLWGWATPNEKLVIKTSWIKDLINVQVNTKGDWRVEVKTTNSKIAQTIAISSKTSTIVLDNILFGEVWLCSGQSNMQQPLNGYDGEPTFGALMATAKATNNNLRLFHVERFGSKIPLNDIEKHSGWQKASPNTVGNFSAVAYFFGQQLQEILDCPVGMIHTSWGGSSVQAWISNEALSEHQTINLENIELDKGTQQIPTVLFNAMIHPLIPYTIKGALWYQGETNRTEPEKYKELFPSMVNDWRKRWGIGDFPFYYVQIAPYIYSGNKAFNTSENSAFIRVAQLECLNLISNSGIAITMDCGDENSIHPPKKKEVADRLLFNALNQTYGFKNVDCAAPIYNSLKINDEGIVLNFKNAETGLYAFGKLEGFEIAGEDKVFYPANAKIVNRVNVLVSSNNVSNPVAVRYAWRNWVIGTLFDTNLLPASSFRTDTWNDATQANE